MSRNDELVRLLDELKWSQRGFAVRVVQRCISVGHSGSISPSTVARWCQGTEPRPALAQIVCEVLSEALRREVLPSTLGWTTELTDLVTDSLAYKDVPHAVSMLSGLWRLDAMNRRELLLASIALPALAAAARDALVMIEDTTIAHQGNVRVGPSDVEMIQMHTRHYEALDAQFGGGRFRADFARFLSEHAAPMLNGTYNEKTGRDLYEAVANAAILSGWMAHDDQMNGLAQRYQTQALRLAQATGDDALTARVLIHQTRLTAEAGYRAEALRLARSAALAARNAPGLVKAYAAVTEARAWALNGDAAKTEAATITAREYFDTPSESPAWLDWFDRPELEGQAAWALTMAGRLVPAEQALAVAQGKGDGMRRDQLGLLITAAELARQRGDTDAQRSHIERATVLAADVKSPRVQRRIKQLHEGVPVTSF